MVQRSFKSIILTSIVLEVNYYEDMVLDKSCFLSLPYKKHRSRTPLCLENPASIKRGRFGQIIIYLNNNNI